MSELTPLDILSKTFARRLKGYDAEEVHQFLTLVAESVENLLRDRGELRQQVHRLERDLVEFRKRENALQDALVSAQRAAEKTVEGARSDAQKILEEGQILADRLVDEAHRRARNIESKIGELRSTRREARASLGRLVELLQGFIEDDHKLEQDERATPQLAVLKSHRGHSEAK
jgi:cell division initiation protein